ncbi:MAG: type II secretion system F family protein [Nanoarchaeota archaeon]|nr:type II secretion system F family protein [Nanoarchaeota archaeon]
MKSQQRLFFLEEWGKALVPERIRPHLRDYLMKAGIFEVNYKFFGALFYACLAVAIVFYFYLPYGWLRDKSVDAMGTLLYLGLGSFVVVFTFLIALSLIVMGLVYFYLDLIIFKRTKEIEDILPEFLQFVGGNLRGGMSFDRALWNAIRPRFGVLANEVEIAAKKVMTGEDVEDALFEFTKKYDSAMLRRSFDLIIEGMKSGGRIVYLIDKVIENINEAKTLKKEMSASVTSYVIFITFIVLAIAPGLFALSFQLLTIISSFAGQLGGSTGGSSALPINLSEVSINPADFVNFSKLALGVIAVFSSMIVSLISRGNIKSGLKYIPVFIIVTLINYQVFLWLLTMMFAFIAI